jgi:hypothetical protein
MGTYYDNAGPTMKLATSQPTVKRGEEQAHAILEETAICIAASELAVDTFTKGIPHLDTILKERTKKYMKPENNMLYQIGMGLKAHGYDGVYGDEIFNPDGMYHFYAAIHSMEWSQEIFGYSTPNVCSPVFQASFARCKLDEQESPPSTFLNGAGGQVIDYEEKLPGGHYEGLIPYELALLARMNENAVRNALQADDSIRKVKRQGTKYIEVPVEDALRWLEGTRGFTRSKLSLSNKTNVTTIAVPIARDGTFFNVNCRRPSGFYIGPKGAESSYDTFEAALKALNAMDVPYWRRPNMKSGVHGIVRGVDVVEKTRTELGLED